MALSIELFCLVCFDIYWFGGYIFLELLDPSINCLKSICDSGLFPYLIACLPSFCTFVWMLGDSGMFPLRFTIDSQFSVRRMPEGS